MRLSHYYEVAKTSVAGKIIYSIAVGVGGVAILVVFFTAPITVAPISKLMPWIVGFNGALTGYMAMEKAGQGLKYKRLWSVGVGALMVIGVCALLVFIFPTIVDVSTVTIKDLLVWLVVGVICSGFGGVLAVKYDNLKRKGGITA